MRKYNRGSFCVQDPKETVANRGFGKSPHSPHFIIVGEPKAYRPSFGAPAVFVIQDQSMGISQFLSDFQGISFKDIALAAVPSSNGDAPTNDNAQCKQPDALDKPGQPAPEEKTT